MTSPNPRRTTRRVLINPPGMLAIASAVWEYVAYAGFFWFGA